MTTFVLPARADVSWGLLGLREEGRGRRLYKPAYQCISLITFNAQVKNLRVFTLTVYSFIPLTIFSRFSCSLMLVDVGSGQFCRPGEVAELCTKVSSANIYRGRELDSVNFVLPSQFFLYIIHVGKCMVLYRVSITNIYKCTELHNLRF